jgi:predicted ATP-grasp superfamily ATP-dependent carboligase
VHAHVVDDQNCLKERADSMRPVCIVLGLETQIGLHLVRELGGAGIRVVGVTHDPRAIGLRSRALWRGVVVSQPRSAELLVLRGLGDELGACSLLAVSEANLSWLSAHRGEFGVVRPVLPEAEALTLVLNKRMTLAAAARVGLDVPQTVEPRSMQEVHQISQAFPFPAVLKWSDPNAVAARLESLGLALVKAEYVYTPQEFLRVAERYEGVGAWPLVQEYCPGYGLGQFFYMHKGQPVRRFQHKRVAEWPPEGGFSSVCDAIALTEHSQLQEASIALLREIGWEGVAMVEYRHDPATGRSKLMEVNGRYWGSFPLAAHCGAGFALISYYLDSLQSLPQLPPVREQLRCRMVATELKRLHRIVLQPQRILDRRFKVEKWREMGRFLGDFLRPGVRYYVWSWSDPKPFLQDLANLLRRR